MAVTLYIASVQPFSGKSALCVGLGMRFVKDGFSICYMKPVSTMARVEDGQVIDDDALRFKELFNLPHPMEELVPVALTPQIVEGILRGTIKEDFESKLKEIYRRHVHHHDVFLLEGGGSLREGYIVGLSPLYIAELLEAKSIAIVKYDSDLTAVDDALLAKRRLGDSLLGVVLNMVPKPRLDFVEQVVKPYLEERGVRVLAVMPRERLLASVSVGELVEVLEGEVLCCPEGCNELVEHIMIGAMTIESALSHFRRRANKAVITGGDRPDIQLAALETPTKCLILTGNIHPSPIILSRAEEIGVPIILVRHDTFTTVQLIEKFFGKSRFYQEKKIAMFERLLEERFDFDRLYGMIGLK